MKYEDIQQTFGNWQIVLPKNLDLVIRENLKSFKIYERVWNEKLSKLARLASIIEESVRSIFDAITPLAFVTQRISDQFAEIQRMFQKQLPLISQAFQNLTPVLQLLQQFSYVIVGTDQRRSQEEFKELGAQYVITLTESRYLNGLSPLEVAILRGLRKYRKKETATLQQLQKIQKSNIQKKISQDIRRTQFNIEALTVAEDYLLSKGTKGAESNYIVEELRKRMIETILKWSRVPEKKRIIIMKQVVDGDPQATNRVVNKLANLAAKKLNDVLKDFEKATLIDDENLEYDPKFIVPDTYDPTSIAMGGFYLDVLEEKGSKQTREVVQYRAENLTKTGRLLSIRTIADDLGLSKKQVETNLKKARGILKPYVKIRQRFRY